MPPRDEKALVEGVAAGDPDAVAEFLERTHHPLYCMAARLAVDPETRRDWSHDVLLGVLDDLERGRFEYRGPGSLWGWFRKRAHYRLLDVYRKSRLTVERERPAGGPQELPSGDGMPPPSAWTGWVADDPDAELERVEVQAALERCLQALSNEDHRNALELRLFQDLPYDEIAHRIGVPLNTLRAWIRRGRLALRRCLVAALDLAERPQLSPDQDPSSSRRRTDA